MKKESMRRAVWLLVCIAAMAVLLALASCKSVEIAKEKFVTKTDTCFVERWRLDSVVIETLKHDSVFVQMKGDTVIFNHWRTEYRDRWRDRVVRDSIYISKADTVIVETVLREEKKLTWLQQARMTVGTVVILFLLVVAALKAFTLFIKKE